MKERGQENNEKNINGIDCNSDADWNDGVGRRRDYLEL